MGNSCQSKHRPAAPSLRPYEVEAHVFLVLSERKCVQILNCPANLEDSFKDICGTAIQIAINETKHKDHQLKRALKNFIPDWFAYKNGETCLVEDVDVDEEKRPFKPIYGPPLMSHATFVFAAKSVRQYVDQEDRQGTKGEFFGPYGLIQRPNLEPHFYIRKSGKIVSYEGQKMGQNGKKPLTFLAKVMLANHPPPPGNRAKDHPTNADGVLSAHQLASFMGDRRNWRIPDIERYFEELSNRKLGTRKSLLQYEGLEDRKEHRFTHLGADTFFYKKVRGEKQRIELHKLGLKLGKLSNGRCYVKPLL